MKFGSEDETRQCDYLKATTLTRLPLCTIYLLRFYLDKLQGLSQSFIAVAFVSISIQCYSQR